MDQRYLIIYIGGYDETFDMIQSMCYLHIDRYDWFVRVMDDSYVNVDNLVKLIQTLDPRKWVSPYNKILQLCIQSNFYI